MWSCGGLRGGRICGRRRGNIRGSRGGHVHLGHKALAGAAYTFFVILPGWFQIVTGLALYSENHPGGFYDRLVGWVIPLLGSIRTSSATV